MKETLEAKVARASSLLDILLIMKEKTMQDLHVASLAFVKEIISQPDANKRNSYGILRVAPFPLNTNQDEYSINAYYFNPEYIFSENDIVLIIFCDLNFISNLNVVDSTQKQTQDTLKHSLKYGIVIPLLPSDKQ
jgi:hypothetical protein